MLDAQTPAGHRHHLRLRPDREDAEHVPGPAPDAAGQALRGLCRTWTRHRRPGQADRHRGAVAAFPAGDAQSGTQAAGIRGVPGIEIDGEIISGAQPLAVTGRPDARRKARPPVRRDRQWQLRRPADLPPETNRARSQAAPGHPSGFGRMFRQGRLTPGGMPPMAPLTCRAARTGRAASSHFAKLPAVAVSAVDRSPGAARPRTGSPARRHRIRRDRAEAARLPRPVRNAPPAAGTANRDPAGRWRTAPGTPPKADAEAGTAGAVPARSLRPPGCHAGRARTCAPRRCRSSCSRSRPLPAA